MKTISFSQSSGVIPKSPIEVKNFLLGLDLPVLLFVLRKPAGILPDILYGVLGGMGNMMGDCFELTESVLEHDEVRIHNVRYDEVSYLSQISLSQVAGLLNGYQGLIDKIRGF